MPIKKNFFKTFFITLSFVFISSGLLAQFAPQTSQSSSYSDKELKQFVNAVSMVMVIQESGQMQMIESIEENDISIDRFNELIAQAQEQGIENISASEEELTAFNNSLNEMQMLQMQMQQSMQEAINNEGLEIDQYQDIMQSYEVDPAVKEKIDQYFSELEE